jgi:glycosyltransferase involved in cell wall biosynthesis
MIEQKTTEISVVVPCRSVKDTYLTVNSLKKQVFRSFKIIIVPDQGKGANWARNRGFLEVTTPYVLFSDDDIEWEDDALDVLHRKLEDCPQNAYSYGWYTLGEKVTLGRVPFRPRSLVKGNFITTMSLIRTEAFPGFDENLKRLQDWDLWLTMLRQHKTPVYVDKMLFRTKIKENGISRTEDLKVATKYITEKHNLIR